MGESCEKRFFVSPLGEELPTKWRFGMMALVNNSLRAAGQILLKITISIKAFYDF
jgi:hypothetical protein